MVHESWKQLFDSYEFDLDALYNEPVPVYPPRDCLFRVFEMPVNEIRLVILGQDPYHGHGQAHGLSFSVLPGVAKPPSLLNICKELKAEFPERDYKFPSGCLEPWTKQGIFLLNTALTVRESSPNSHAAHWSEFTNDVIRFISDRNPKAVFLLLGSFAKSKAEFIENKKLMVTGVHPSPLSASKGFFGSGIFKKVEGLTGCICWDT